MNDLSSYPGEELILFEKATKWKKYFSSFIQPFIKKEVIEAGAGLGSNTLLLNNGSAHSWTLLEPDTQMSALLQKKISEHSLPANCTLVSGTIKELKGQHPDTIIYIDVLEHIEKDKEELQAAAELLSPGGHLIVLSPAFQSLFSAFDKAIGHYRRYTKASLKKVVPGKLEKVQLRYLDSTGYFMSLMNRALLRQKYPTQKQVNFWNDYAIPVSRITDRIVLFSFGKTILGTWKKI
jgi:ubiquinone/menaquinone biosynthesis C-methylase UbiE